MVKTIRYSLGKVNDNEKVKNQRMDEFDQLLTNELKLKVRLESIHTIIISEEEFMIAVLTDKKENRLFIPALGIIIIQLLYIMFLLSFRL